MSLNGQDVVKMREWKSEVKTGHHAWKTQRWRTGYRRWSAVPDLGEATENAPLAIAWGARGVFKKWWCSEQSTWAEWNTDMRSNRYAGCLNDRMLWVMLTILKSILAVTCSLWRSSWPVYVAARFCLTKREAEVLSCVSVKRVGIV